ncbi:ABC transporter permease [Alloacidobacterium dinghuense]|uniref:ABC transporter permease n=1 Tax=Alloacidobacterium dinghuense TaxID=2763107 RepID=A0A7G8BFF4_9BACT|nr:ABC transporter permease [Alloacidobacterium dinghuense]QNI31274.1 ABC transporter permease [Alloacidobacterium dinghuense]
MQNLLQNLRFSLRMLFKNPGLTITVLLTLALGIGANTAIFTVDYATLLAPLPYPQPDQVVMVWSKIQTFHNGVSAGDYLDWKAQSKSFQSLDAWTGGSFNIATKDQPAFVPGNSVTADFFNMQRLPFFLGRGFLPEEGQDGKNHVVVLSHKLWLKLCGDMKIVGKTMQLDGTPYTVVGVEPPGFQDRLPAQLTVPLVFKPEQINHDFHFLLVMGRLKDGVTIKQAQADMNAVTDHIAQTYPKSDKGWGAFVEPLKNDFLPSERIQTLWLLLGAVGFVLLIACVNVANLLLAKSMTRQKEIAVRSSLGATPGKIFAQLITESLLLASFGGALGVGVGYAMLRGLIAVMPEGTLPSEADLSLNFPILLFTLAATTLAGLLFGCIPAWIASRVDPAETLKEGGRSGTSVGRHQLRRVLVIGEFTLALALLAGAGLTIHSFLNLQRVDLGVKTDHVMTFFLSVPDSRPKDPDHIVAYYRQMLSAIQGVPGVMHASAETGLPLEGSGFGMPFELADKPTVADPSQRPNTSFGMVTPDYFQTFGIKLVKGRFFNDQDTANSVKVAVVNEEFVNKYMKGADPLQKRVRVEQLIPGVTKLGPYQEWQIVGVFHNVRSRGFREDYPEMEIPFWQIPWPSAGMGVRTQEDPASMLKSIAAAVHSVDPQIALADPKTMEQVHDDVLANDRFTLILFACFAAVALLLSALGIYGVMAFSVAQRSHEIALRMALGATRNRVVTLILKEGVILAFCGLGLGLVGAYFVGRAMRSTLYGVGAMDLSAFAVVGLVLLVAALLACYLPARRAASVEPMQLLRME